MTRRLETRSSHTSGLFPHQIVSGPSSRMDEEREYRLCSAAYHLEVALSDFFSWLRERLQSAVRKTDVEALDDR